MKDFKSPIIPPKNVTLKSSFKDTTQSTNILIPQSFPHDTIPSTTSKSFTMLPQKQATTEHQEDRGKPMEGLSKSGSTQSRYNLRNQPKVDYYENDGKRVLDKLGMPEGLFDEKLVEDVDLQENDTRYDPIKTFNITKEKKPTVDDLILNLPKDQEDLLVKSCQDLRELGFPALKDFSELCLPSQK